MCACIVLHTLLVIKLNESTNTFCVHRPMYGRFYIDTHTHTHRYVCRQNFHINVLLVFTCVRKDMHGCMCKCMLILVFDHVFQSLFIYPANNVRGARGRARRFNAAALSSFHLLPLPPSSLLPSLVGAYDVLCFPCILPHLFECVCVCCSNFLSSLHN